MHLLNNRKVQTTLMIHTLCSTTTRIGDTTPLLPGPDYTQHLSCFMLLGKQSSVYKTRLLQQRSSRPARDLETIPQIQNTVKLSKKMVTQRDERRRQHSGNARDNGVGVCVQFSCIQSLNLTRRRVQSRDTPESKRQTQSNYPQCPPTSQGNTTGQRGGTGAT